MSMIQKLNGKFQRASWMYPADDDSTEATRLLEMLESVRNTVERVQTSQMLQCDVAHAIKDIAKNIRGLRRDLKNGKTNRR